MFFKLPVYIDFSICSSYRLQFFTELERNITQVQAPDKQPRMAECFQDLMENVERSMTSKNRDR